MSTLPVPPTAATFRHLRLEVGKGLRLMWRRRVMAAVGPAVFGLDYLGITLFIGGGHLARHLMVLTVPALLATVVAATVAIHGTGGIAEEINGGTLEQAQLSPAGPQLQLLGRVGALAIEGLAAAAVLGVVFIAGVGLPVPLRPAVLAPAVLTVLDALGYGLIMTALVVRVASIGAITHVFNMVIMVFAGMMVPITACPAGLRIFAALVPTAPGVHAINTSLAGGLAAAWSAGILPWLIVHTGVSLGAGLAIYAVNIRHARQEGGLSPR